MQNYRLAKTKWDKEYWQSALTECTGNISQLARGSGLYRADVYTKLKQHRLTPDRSEIVYFVQSDQGFIKIGKTTKDIKQRVSALQCSSPHKLQLLATTHKYKERELHSMFAELRLNGEWFAPEPPLLEFIASL